MTVIFDIESNGLYQDVHTVHCISIKVDDDPTEVYTSRDIGNSAGTIEAALEILANADVLVGHNIINYDIPALKKVYPDWNPKGDVRDTLLMSRLAYPNLMLTDASRKTIPPKLKGGHSLKAWGYRLRKLKDEYEEQWDYLSISMIEYCRQDAEVTYALYNRLLTRNIPDEAIKLEQDFAEVISRQEKYGVYFNVEAAQKLHVALLEEVDRAEEDLLKVFTPLETWTPKNYPKIDYKKNGEKSQVLLNQEMLGCHFNEDMEWGYFKMVEFNPSSRHHIARWLKEVYNWKPVEYTDKGSIIINEEVLDTLEFPEGKILAHYFNVKKLVGQLAEGKNAWMKAVVNGRIHGSVNTLGAVTRRCTHSKPNMAQVPSARKYKGHEARELFCVPKGKKLVGCDAEGLELRTLAHYMARYDRGKYADTVDKGDKKDKTDAHNVNMRNAGLTNRDDAKTFIYAFLYGAGDGKIGEIVNGDAEVGRKLKAKFLKSLPALQRLINKVEETYKSTGAIKALDGNLYHIRSSHSALNTLLQGAGALVMKYYLVFLDRNLSEVYTNSESGQMLGVEYEFVLNVHDEVQIECDERISKEVAKICEDTFDEVTEYLNFRIPLRGKADIGDSWAETH